MRRPLFYIFALLTLMVSGCSNKDGTNETKHVKLSQDSWRVWTINDIVWINLLGDIGKTDTFDAHEIIGASYALCDLQRIKLLINADIVSAEKITFYYPTIWSGLNDDIIQFIYLFNLCYKDVMPLKINNGVIEYPQRGVWNKSAFKKHFNSITQEQILASIDSVPHYYNYKGKNTYEAYSWPSEKKVWKMIAGRYKPGELTDDENEPFDADPYEIRLVVTFRKGDSLFTKTFCDEAVIGN